VLLSDRDLQAELDAGRLGVDPFDPEMLQPSSIDVRLDRFFRVFVNTKYTHIDPAQQQDELTSLVEPDGEEPFVLHPGEFVLGGTFERVTLPDDLAGRLEGKALAVDTPIPTPSGWRTMGGLRVDDEVFGVDGVPCRVLAATPEMLGRPCREVVFSDGQTIVADIAHRWSTTTKSARRHGGPAAVRTTGEIERSLWTGNEYTHHLPLAEPVRYPEQQLPVDPYVLGVRLGTGTNSGTNSGAGIINGTGDEQVPEVYLRASVPQRMALLQGLMDSDGHVDATGRCEFVSIREHLCDAVLELAASLGLRPVKRKKTTAFREAALGVAFQVNFTPHLTVFRLERKVARLRVGRVQRFRAVVDVRPVPTRPVRCIQVDAEDGLFLAGATFIPTHNSSLGRLGLLTHSTAGFIDPGFTGHITLELSNVANLPITLWPGMKIGQLCLFRLSSPAEHPYGSARAGSRYQGQRGPTPSRAYRNFHRVDTRR
jgi:deoxycytidine triphosphate deaminase